MKQREREKKRPTKLTSNHHQGTSSPYLYIKETFNSNKTIDCCVSTAASVVSRRVKRGSWVYNNQRRTKRWQAAIEDYVRIRYEPLLTSLFFAASMNSARLFDTNGSRGKRWREFPRQSREEERLDPSRSNGTCDLIVVREIEVAARPSYHFCLFFQIVSLSSFSHINIYTQDFDSSQLMSILIVIIFFFNPHIRKRRNKLIFFNDRTKNGLFLIIS